MSTHRKGSTGFTTKITLFLGVSIIASQHQWTHLWQALHVTEFLFWGLLSCRRLFSGSGGTRIAAYFPFEVLSS